MKTFLIICDFALAGLNAALAVNSGSVVNLLSAGLCVFAGMLLIVGDRG